MTGGGGHPPVGGFAANYTNYEQLDKQKFIIQETVCRLPLPFRSFDTGVLSAHILSSRTRQLVASGRLPGCLRCLLGCLRRCPVILYLFHQLHTAKNSVYFIALGQKPDVITGYSPDEEQYYGIYGDCNQYCCDNRNLGGNICAEKHIYKIR